MKICPPSANIFFINGKRTKQMVGDTILYSPHLNMKTDTIINNIQGIPIKAKAKTVRLPGTVLVKT